MEPTPQLVETLVDSHRQFLAFLERRINDPADAEEVLQTAFVKAVEKQHTIQDDDSVVAWFYRVLRNAVVDYYRHRDARRRTLEEARHSFESVQPTPEMEQAICQCLYGLLPTLKDDYAELLRSVDLQSRSIAEVAAESGMTPNNTRVKLHRARSALRKQLVVSCGTCAEHGCLDCTCRGSAA